MRFRFYPVALHLFRSTLLAAACLVPTIGLAAPGWSWLTPTPTPYTFRSAALVDGTHGFAAGNGAALVETRNGGLDWLERDIGLPRAANLTRVRFADAWRGYIVGLYDPSQLHAADGLVLRTSDGGNSWSQVDIPNVFLLDLAMTGENGAIAVGIDTVSGAASIARSADGTHWSTSPASELGLLYGVAAPAPGVLVAVGIDGITGAALILRSVDDGANWTATQGPIGQVLYCVAFADPQRGVAGGTAGTLLATTDGGVTWSPRASGTSLDISDAVYQPDGRIVAAANDVDANGAILVSSDDGDNWSQQPMDRAVNGIALSGPSGIAVGFGGNLLATHDRGASWTPSLRSVSSMGLSGVAFADRDHGIAVGAAGDTIRTVDGGRHWEDVPSPSPYLLYGVSMSGTQFAMAVGGDIQAASPTAVRSTDGGATWTDVTTFEFPVYALQSVACTAPGICIAVGQCGGVARTEDGGANWIEARAVDCEHNSPPLHGVDFASPELGLAVGNGTIIRTTDGGVSWNPVDLPPGVELLSVSFPDTGHAVAVGAFLDGRMARLASSDGGMTWNDRSADEIGRLVATDFADASHGMAVEQGGVTFATDDGGATWHVADSVGGTNFMGVTHFGAERTVVVGFSNGHAAVRAYADEVLRDGFE